MILIVIAILIVYLDIECCRVSEQGAEDVRAVVALYRNLGENHRT